MGNLLYYSAWLFFSAASFLLGYFLIPVASVSMLSLAITAGVSLLAGFVLCKTVTWAFRQCGNFFITSSPYINNYRRRTMLLPEITQQAELARARLEEYKRRRITLPHLESTHFNRVPRVLQKLVVDYCRDSYPHISDDFQITAIDFAFKGDHTGFFDSIAQISQEEKISLLLDLSIIVYKNTITNLTVLESVWNSYLTQQDHNFFKRIFFSFIKKKFFGYLYVAA